MPSKSKAQADLMRAAAHNKEFADKVGVPQSVAKEFAAADKAKTKKKTTKNCIIRTSMATVAETELEQKTSEYIGFVREYFQVAQKSTYKGANMMVAKDNDGVILEYWGK